LLCGYCAQQVRILFAFSESVCCRGSSTCICCNLHKHFLQLHHSSIVRFNTMVSIRHTHPLTRLCRLSSPVFAQWNAKSGMLGSGLHHSRNGGPEGCCFVVLESTHFACQADCNSCCHLHPHASPYGLSVGMRQVQAHACHVYCVQASQL